MSASDDLVDLRYKIQDLSAELSRMSNNLNAMDADWRAQMRRGASPVFRVKLGPLDLAKGVTLSAAESILAAALQATGFAVAGEIVLEPGRP